MGFKRNIIYIMTKSIIHHSPQKYLFDTRSFNVLGFASDVKLDLVSKSVIFDLVMKYTIFNYISYNTKRKIVHIQQF